MRNIRNIKKKAKLIGIILAVIAVFVLLIYFGIFWRTMMGLLVLIVVLLHFSVSIHLKASRAEGIDISAKYLFLTLYPRKQKSSSPKKEKAPPAVREDFPEFEDDLTDDLPDAEDDGDDEEVPNVDISELINEAEKIDKQEAAESGSPAPEKGKKGKAKKEKKAPAHEAPSSKEKSKGKLAELKEKFEKIKPYIPIGWKAVKKFCKAIRFEGVEVQAEVGRFDAHEAAIYYGAVQKIVFDILSKIALFFTLKLKRADVYCRFGENMIDGRAELTVRVRPSTLIAIAFCTGINALRVFLRERRKRKKAQKEEQANKSNNAAQAAAS